MKAAAVVVLFAASVAFGWRIAAAAEQCLLPPFAYSASCFAWDVLTGEDL